ncbi:flagellar basal-body MS-ring/collar protein FliF [Aestuariicoccus sp. MJ-SS9]|uniref:flagellar basal-body MS-ring/collar protein FliF n=1 Tax=Aestuariicoccus sp. MJ-SS9 TaxID=3079855 RepID=UPI00290C757B|nr:flagellar basal-body MS-ring/collar protein FliF [Aestuariicoccus sp. MJ-SS9]MDU8910786.1 flagellar basal-body MS-ring/collar protein FliF [Aestuariicoccus sp. MJ-SS9]
MKQIVKTWTALGLRRQLVVAGATVAMVLAILAMSRMATAPNMTLLYAGLENGAAGDVVKALEQRGVAYEVNGGAILVPSGQRDQLRLTLASEGLPANGSQGYELLDTLSGFGTTSQMFDAAYWRAKEGELARTIVATPYITSARVHIANSSANPFQRDVNPSASVSVTTSGGALTVVQARALKHLVAAAVPGLVPENVSVIDAQGGLVGADDESAPGQTADDKAMALRDRVQRLIEARVGLGNAVVEVAVDTVTESESILERRFDPENCVVISSDTTETSNQSQDNGADVTVASNLPDGEAAGGGESSSRNSETRERLNYEVSETTREVMRAPGAVRRLTVAVLVNGTFETDGTGAQVFAPLPEAELDALRDLVASAVGYDEARGDVITLRSLAFERPEGLGTEVLQPGLLERLALDPMALIQMAILALVTLVLGLFVVRPLLAGGSAAALPAPEGGGMALAPPPDMADLPALNGEIDPDDGLGPRPVLGGGDFGEMGTVDFDAPSEDPVDRLRNLIEERKSETVEILRSWLDEPEETRQ